MKYHPTPELLIKYSAGGLAPALSFVVAAHIHHCDACRAHHEALEAMGGQAIDDSSDTQMSTDSFDKLWQQLDQQIQIDETDLEVALASDYHPLLNNLLAGKFEHMDWQSVAGKIDRATLDVDDTDNDIELLRLSANARVPKHTHKGNEYTLILQGSYSDEMGDFSAGDFVHMGSSHQHRPIAGKDGCVCIAVTDAPMHFTGALGPVLNLFSR